MPRGWCARVLDVLCPFFRRKRLGGGGRSSSGAAGRQHDISLNMIVHGECGVGKTSLRNRWVDGIFTGDVAPTFGVDFNIKTLDLVQEEEKQEDEEEEKGEIEVRTAEGVGRRLEDDNAAEGATAGESPCLTLSTITTILLVLVVYCCCLFLEATTLSYHWVRGTLCRKTTITFGVNFSVDVWSTACKTVRQNMVGGSLWDIYAGHFAVGPRPSGC